MPSTALFIDIDGPLHPQGAAALTPAGELVGENLFCWAPALAAMLKELPHVQLVVHSSWRHLFETDDELRQVMPPSLAERVAGCTPREVMGRHDSILEYVRRHRVERYAILDDAADLFPQGVAELVLCSPATGLSDSEVVWTLRRKLQTETRD